MLSMFDLAGENNNFFFMIYAPSFFVKTRRKPLKSETSLEKKKERKMEWYTHEDLNTKI